MVMGSTRAVIETLWNSEIPTAFLEVMDTVDAFKEYNCRLSVHPTARLVHSILFLKL